MKKPSIYLETSFVNRLADPLKREAKIRNQQLSSREWWTAFRRKYSMVTSTFTIEECCGDYNNPRIVRLRRRCLAAVVIVRPPAPHRVRLAAALCGAGRPLPPDELVDAHHIATAAIAGCRFLLTWNQKHIANPFTRRIVDNIIESHGYQPPIVATPDQFLEAALD